MVCAGRATATGSRTAFDCGFRCPMLAVIDDGAFVAFADGSVLLVCEECRNDLERGALLGVRKGVLGVDGATRRLFLLGTAEGLA